MGQSRNVYPSIARDCPSLSTPMDPSTLIISQSETKMGSVNRFEVTVTIGILATVNQVNRDATQHK